MKRSGGLLSRPDTASRETMNEREELERCINDPVYFIEKYLLVNGERVQLMDYQKEFVRNFHGEKNQQERRNFLKKSGKKEIRGANGAGRR